MSGLVHYVDTMRGVVSSVVQHRCAYDSLGDAVKVAALKIAVTRLARPIFREKTVTIRLRGQPASVSLRQRTSDVRVLAEIFEEGAYAPVKRWALPGDATVVDLGGNIGLSVRYFSSLFPSARFVVVEADEANRSVLEANCQALIRTGRVSVIGALVGAADGTASLDRSGESWMFRKADGPSGAAGPIECLSMVSLLRRTEIETVNLLKCDIEGSEAEVFRDCGGWIERVRHLVVETHAPYSLAALYEDLRRAGWHFAVLQQTEGPRIAHCFLRQLP